MAFPIVRSRSHAGGAASHFPRRTVVLSLFAVLVLGGGLVVFVWQPWWPTYEPAYTRPFGICVTFDGDPTLEATIHYQSLPRDEVEASHARLPEAECYFDEQTRDGNPDAYAKHATGETRTIAGLHDGRYVHRIRLKNLRAGCTYYFVVGDETTGYSQELKFKTLPGGDAPLRFVVGGDMGGFPSDEYPNAAPLLHEAAKRDPQFAVIGGDIAYAGGDLRRAERWDAWFENWGTGMLTSDGCLVPIVAAMGNHEANNRSMENPRECAPFYTAFLRDDPPYSYFTLRLSDYARLFVLDSGYLAPADGEQAAWLANELKSARDVQVKFAVYHVPMYPSYGDFDGDHSAKERQTWLPLFDEYHVDVAFENHDHTFKRSCRLRGNQVDPAGTLFVGDGCFGVKPRRIHSSNDRWYLEKSASQPHFWLVSVSREEGIDLQAITPEGRVFDHCSLPAKAPELPER